MFSLLSTSSSSLLLNGTKGQWFKHFIGLRQGNPLLPMLFILAMEPLQKLFKLAMQGGLLSPIHNRSAATLSASLYVDDVAIFDNPAKEDVQNVSNILNLFGIVFGFITNRSKAAVYPIHCENVNLSESMESFSCQIKTFPCNYMGLRLHYRNLPFFCLVISAREDTNGG